MQLFPRSALALLLAIPLHADSELPCEYAYYSSDLAAPRDVVYATGFPAPGETVRVQLHDAAPNRGVLLVSGAAQADEWLAPGVALLVSPDAVTFGVTDADGFVSLPFPIADSPDVVGATAYFQWIVLDPGGSGPESSTRGLAITVVEAPAPLHDERPFAGEFALTLADRTELTADLDGHVVAALARDVDTGEVDFSLAGLGGGTGVVRGASEEHPPFRLQLETPLHFFDDPEAEAGFEVPATVSVAWDLPIDPDSRDPRIDLEWFEFEGTLRWERLSDLPRLRFSGESAPAPTTQTLAGAGVTFDVTLEQLEGLNNKVKKKEQCVYVFITRDGDGKNPSTTMDAATAAIEKASETWCKQCCIQLKIGNPDTDGDRKPDPCFLDGDSYPTPNKETNKLGYALMLWEAQNKLKAAGKKGECVALVFVKDVGDKETLGEASPGGEFAVIEHIADPAKFGHVLAHEMGHVFGNSHPENDPQGENKKRSKKNLMREGASVGSDEIHPEQCGKARARKALKCLEQDCVMKPEDTTKVK